MDVLYERCAGLDVHKKTVVACVLRSGPAGTVVRQTRTFGTMMDDLERLRSWLQEEGCSHVSMEATGVYWKPVFNVLEEHFELVVVNAEHVHQVPGRKTDVKDAEWLADLLRHGLLQGSFIPDRPWRELRELARFRTALIQDRARAVNRLQKTLEGANIKLASVLTDITGVSGQRILKALLRGENDPEVLAGLAHGRLQPKREALERALLGHLSGPLQFLVGQQLAQIEVLDSQIAACDRELEERLLPFAPILDQLDLIPGVGPRTAQTILVEIGPDMAQFATARHLASWAGICPGNKASGGKSRPAKTRKGNPWLKRALTEAGWAASRSKHSYLASLYRRMAARKGRKRAVVAVGHAILIIVYYMLSRGVPYQDLGEAYFDERDREGARRSAVRRLQALGYEVQLTARLNAA